MSLISVQPFSSYEIRTDVFQLQGVSDAHEQTIKVNGVIIPPRDFELPLR
jgi:hypothetical protein